MNQDDFGSETPAMWWRVWRWRGSSGFLLVGCYWVALQSAAFLGDDDFGAVALNALWSPLDASVPFVLWTACGVSGVFVFFAEVREATQWGKTPTLSSLLRALGLWYLCMYALRHEWFLPLQWHKGFWWVASEVFYHAWIGAAATNLTLQLCAWGAAWFEERRYAGRERGR